MSSLGADVSEFKKLVAWLLFPPCSMRRDLDLAFFRKSNLWSKKAKKRKQLKKAKSRSLLILHGGKSSHATNFLNSDTYDSTIWIQVHYFKSRLGNLFLFFTQSSTTKSGSSPTNFSRFLYTSSLFFFIYYHLKKIREYFLKNIVLFFLTVLKVPTYTYFRIIRSTSQNYD